MNMNLTNYNPNNDRGITTQPNLSGARCFDGEDLCKYLMTILTVHYSEKLKRKITEAITKGMD